MWNRACPLCFAKVPRTLVLTGGEELTCPSCRTPLELSRESRVLGAGIGLAVTYVAVRAALGGGKDADWLLPLVGAVLGYSIASAAALFFFSDLVVQPKLPGSHSPHLHR